MIYMCALNEFLGKFNLSLEMFDEKENSISIKQIFENKSDIYSYINYDYNDIFLEFKEAFKILIYPSNDYSEMRTIKFGFDKETIFEFVEDITDKEINLEINISKSKIKELIKEKNSSVDLNYNLIVYFKTSTFSEYIKTTSFEKIEKDIIRPEKYTLIVILDKEIKMINDYISIISPNFIGKIKLNKDLINNTSNKILIRDNFCNWINGTKFINPSYFYFEIENKDDFTCDDELKNLLMNKFTQLVFAFTFNYTNYEKDKHYSFISGYKKLKIDYIHLENIEVEKYKYLKKIYDWIYSTDKIEEKIIIARNIISMFLCDECSSSYYYLIVNNSKEIYESIEINFEVYLEGNIKEYFNQIYYINDAMEKKVNQVSNQIDALSENFNKNFLTTVGASIVTIIGYLSKPSKNLIVYIIGGYMLYILINALVISITSKSKYNSIMNNYDNWVNSFGKILEVKLNNKQQFEKLNKKLQNRFYWYWGFYIFFNSIIIGLGIFCLINLDNLINIINTMFK